VKFEISSQDVDVAVLRSELMSPGCGGYTAFEGWVRDHHQGRAVSGLHYEAYEDLARAEGMKILREAEEKFGPVRLACVHRIGDLAVGDLAVWVGAAAPLLTAFMSPTERIPMVVSFTSLGFLALLGGVSARTGGAPVGRAVARVTFWGALAMAATAGIGALFGVAA